MKTKNAVTRILVALSMMMMSVFPAFAGEASGDNMQLLLDKIKADKKLFVASQMQLTESEAKGFWPVYEAYQNELMMINNRIGSLIDRYAQGYRTDTLTEENAKALITELMSIQEAEAELQSSSAPKLEKALPSKKVLRYLQIENKIRAAVKFDLSTQIPLAK